jgi:ABC-2 type transport system permease protein
MNAINESHELPRSTAVATKHPTHTFKMLLKREFWEHKGGFLWAPLVAGGILLLLTLMGVGAGEVLLRKVPDRATINVEGGSFQVNGLDLSQLTANMSPSELHEFGGVIDASLYMAASWPFIVLAFVVFFYCLGSLYDDRRDRSVLFWKSLPISDRDTVLSKVASATLMAPAIAALAAIATVFGSMVLYSFVVVLHGGNPISMLWGPASPLKVSLHLIASIPVYALWALPTVGWLMLCSAWARSKPFLWAIMIPVFAGIFVSWFDLMQLFDLETGWFWKNVVARSLLSVAPGSWFDAAQTANVDFDGPQAVHSLLSLRTMYSVLATPQLWVGAVAGAVMIFGAIRLRRWRDEG